MAKRIITISREFGSGGCFIGEEVAKQLGIKYYDKDIIARIAEQSGFSAEYIEEKAELSPKKGLLDVYKRQAPSCPAPAGGSVTINKPAHTTYGDGQSENATLTENNWQGLSLIHI